MLLDRSDIYMIKKQLIAVHDFPKRILTSLSVDEVRECCNRNNKMPGIFGLKDN